MPGQVYQFRIELEHTEPVVWRNFVVSADITLLEFHCIIQDVIGWDNYHLFSFNTPQGEFGQRMDDDLFSEASYKDAGEIKLHQVFGSTKDISYEYDFGDGWDHKIKLENVFDADQVTFPVPSCLAGENACPPEDCGGVYGFQQIKNAVANRDDEDSQELLEWVGLDYDPFKFSLEEANQRIENGHSKLELEEVQDDNFETMEFDELCEYFIMDWLQYSAEAVDAACKRKDELKTWVLAELDAIINSPVKELTDDDSIECYYLLVFASFLGFTEAHQSIIKFVRLPEDTLEVLISDFITEFLHRALYDTCGRDFTLIKELILDASVNEYCRHAALRAISYGWADGHISREEVVELYTRLCEHMDSGCTGVSDVEFESLILMEATEICLVEIRAQLELLFKKHENDRILPIGSKELAELSDSGVEVACAKLRDWISSERNQTVHDNLSWLGRKEEEVDSYYDNNYDDDYDVPPVALGKKERKAKKKKRKTQKAARKKNRKKK